jgi:hypothetical protein
MLRTFLVKEDTDFKSLSSTLLDARFGGAQADAAAKQLRALNPHADLDRLKAGTVIFIPDLPQFKTSAATSAQAGLVKEFQELVSEGLNDTAREVEQGNAARVTERAELGAILKGDALRKIAASNKEVAQRVSDAQKAMTNEEEQDKQAQEDLAAISKAAIAALAQISKLIG